MFNERTLFNIALLYKSNKFFILDIPFMFLSRARDYVEINVKDYKKCQECDEILSADGST